MFLTIPRYFSYVFPSPALVPLVFSRFLAEHVTGQFRLLILVAPCWMEAPWLPTVPNILDDYLHCCHCKKSWHGSFGEPGAQCGNVQYLQYATLWQGNVQLAAVPYVLIYLHCSVV